MNFVNLAHGAFAMAGGYTTVLLMDRAGVPFLLCLPAAFIVAAALGLLLERTLYIHMYGRSHLEQVLFSIGLVFMAVAATDYILGSSQRNITLPEWLRGRREILGPAVEQLGELGMRALDPLVDHVPERGAVRVLTHRRAEVEPDAEVRQLDVGRAERVDGEPAHPHEPATGVQVVDPSRDAGRERAALFTWAGAAAATVESYRRALGSG